MGSGELLGSSWPTQADLNLATLTGSSSPAPGTHLEQLIEDGVGHLVTTVDPAAVVDPSVRALFEMVEDCPYRRDGDVRVVELDGCEAVG